MFVYWNNSSSDSYWNYKLEQNWNIREYSSLFVFLELQESRVSEQKSLSLWQKFEVEKLHFAIKYAKIKVNPNKNHVRLLGRLDFSKKKELGVR